MNYGVLRLNPDKIVAWTDARLDCASKRDRSYMVSLTPIGTLHLDIAWAEVQWL
jgi:hypothetical protein